MKKLNLLIGLLFLATTLSYSQNVGINTTGAAPDAGAGLDINFTDKGVLVPRVNIADLNTIAPVTGSATTSLLVFNTNATTGVGYYYWNGAQWVKFSTAADAWQVDGNAGLNATNNFLGTTDNIAVRIRTNNTNRFEFTTNGRLRSFNIGSVGAPTYSWTGDPNTGIWRPGADILGFSTNGVERMRILANGTTLIGVTAASDNNLFEARVNAGTNWAVNGYNNTDNGGAATFNNLSAGNGYNSAECVTAGSNAGVWGWNQAAGTGVRGTVANTTWGWAGYFQGDVGCTGAYFGSDERWKKNIQDISNPSNSTLSKLMALSPKKYEWDTVKYPGMGFDPEKISYGFIAQELEQIFPELVNNKKLIPNPTKKLNSKSEADNVSGFYMVDYIGLIPITVQAIQEQQTIIEAQNERIDALEQLVLELQKAIEDK